MAKILTIESIIRTNRSSRNNREKATMKRILLDLAIVYRLTVTYCRAQLERPMSREAQIPIGTSQRS